MSEPRVVYDHGELTSVSNTIPYIYACLCRHGDINRTRITYGNELAESCSIFKYTCSRKRTTYTHTMTMTLEKLMLRESNMNDADDYIYISLDADETFSRW